MANGDKEFYGWHAGALVRVASVRLNSCVCVPPRIDARDPDVCATCGKFVLGPPPPQPTADAAALPPAATPEPPPKPNDAPAWWLKIIQRHAMRTKTLRGHLEMTDMFNGDIQLQSPPPGAGTGEAVIIRIPRSDFEAVIRFLKGAPPPPCACDKPIADAETIHHCSICHRRIEGNDAWVFAAARAFQLDHHRRKFGPEGRCRWCQQSLAGRGKGGAC